MARLRARITYANVVATLALFVALGGTTYAAATIGEGDIKDNAVRSNHIKNGEVMNPDLAPNSVGTGKVIDNSLTRNDILESTFSRAWVAYRGQSPVVELNGSDDTDVLGYHTRDVTLVTTDTLLPSGAYEITARIHLFPRAENADPALVDCRLGTPNEPAAIDRDSFGGSLDNPDIPREPLPARLVLFGTSAIGPGHRRAVLGCTVHGNVGAKVAFGGARVMAVRVGAQTQDAVSG